MCECVCAHLFDRVLRQCAASGLLSLCVCAPQSVYFSSSSPSLMLLMEADAPLGEVGGEGRALCQRAGGDGGDGERRGDSSRGGLLQGDSRGDRA